MLNYILYLIKFISKYYEVFHVKHTIYTTSEYCITDTQIEQLKQYQEAVFLWEEKTDLIGSHDKEIFFNRHILHNSPA